MKDSTQKSGSVPRLVRRYPSRRVFQITCAPEVRPPTSGEILAMLNRHRKDTEWRVMECEEDARVIPPEDPLIAAARHEWERNHFQPNE